MPNPHFSDGKILTDPRKNWINQPTNVANVYLFWSSRSFSDSAHSAPLIFSLTILFFSILRGFFIRYYSCFFLANFLEELHGDYAKSFVDWFHFGALKDSGIHSEWFLKIHAQGPLGSQKILLKLSKLESRDFQVFYDPWKLGIHFQSARLFDAIVDTRQTLIFKKKKIVHLTVNLNQQNGRYFFLDISRC